MKEKIDLYDYPCRSIFLFGAYDLWFVNGLLMLSWFMRGAVNTDCFGGFYKVLRGYSAIGIRKPCF